MTGEHFKEDEILSSLNTSARLSKNRKFSNGFGIKEILATLKKQFQ